MSDKRTNEYKVTFEYLKNSKGEEVTAEPIVLSFQNHDNVYKIIDVLKEKKFFQDDAQSEQFAIGLKLFGDVMMRNRDHELFQDLQPAFLEFMKKLKG